MTRATEEQRIFALCAHATVATLAHQVSVLGPVPEGGISEKCEFAYAMLHAAASAGSGENWNDFLRAALEEVIYIQEQDNKQGTLQ